MSCHYFKYYHWFNFFTPNQRKSALLFLLCREFSSKIPRFIIIFVKLTLADSVIWSYINEGSIFLVILFSSSPPPNFSLQKQQKWLQKVSWIQGDMSIYFDNNLFWNVNTLFKSIIIRDCPRMTSARRGRGAGSATFWFFLYLFSVNVGDRVKFVYF